MCIVSCLSASPACVCGRVSSTWDCPRRRLPCRRDSSAPLYRTDGGWLSFGLLMIMMSFSFLFVLAETKISLRSFTLWVSSVVSGRPLRSRAVAGVSLHVCVGLGPVLASHAPSPPAAAAAAWRGRGRVPIAGWSCGGVGPERGLRGGGRRGWCEEWARRG